MTYYNWRDIRDRRLEQTVNPENVARLEGYLGIPKGKGNFTKKYLAVPEGVHLTSEASGFKISQTPHGECFEWFHFSSGEWKASHILFRDNWLFNP